jgi:hypothetical protein
MWLAYRIGNILVPRALLTRGATRGSGQIHIRTGIWLASSNTGYCFLTMFLRYPVMDLARAPRRTARKKGSGYENDHWYNLIFVGRDRKTNTSRLRSRTFKACVLKTGPWINKNVYKNQISVLLPCKKSEIISALFSKLTSNLSYKYVFWIRSEAAYLWSLAWNCQANVAHPVRFVKK